MANIIVVAAVLVAVLLIGLSFVTKIQPGQVGIAYHLNGSTTELKVGYNYVTPWSVKNVWDTKMMIKTFSQGEASDDIYGAQTNEKDYIAVVATMGVHIDAERMDQYISLYGNEQITSERITLLLKTVSRNAIEGTIGNYTTADVMSQKKKIAEEAKALLITALENQPFVIDSFTIDDLIAPENYETAIKEQAELRMKKEKAVLQQELNEQEALANKIKAEGDAKVAETNANSEAKVKQIAAENEAAVKKIAAENEAQVKKLQAEADAEVKKIEAEAQANQITIKAEADAKAVVAQGDAEAKAVAALGDSYKTFPELMELERAKIQAEVEKSWATKWSGYSFEGMSGFNFANLTELFKNLIKTPAVTTVE